MGRQTREEEAHEAQQRLQQAIECKHKHKLQNPPPVAASCAALGNAYGVGIGLYFKTISWLRWLLFWLALCTVPFMIVVNTTRFTTAEHKGQPASPGMAVLPSFSILQSLTFAVVPDDALDQGILSWMNIRLPGFEGVFQMPKQLFLVWISLMDAGSMAVFSFACLLLYKMAGRFAEAVDKATMEVADYTVVVKGLPETTPIDIGHHFSRWGRVMDVVMVKDFGPLLNLASTATSLEQQRKAAESRMVHGRKAVKCQHKIKKLEKKMASFMGQANKQLEKEGFDLKAMFVTFNTQSQLEACMSACPQRWITSWFQRRKDKFLGKYRFWVERAQPPEDYIYENLSVPRLSRYIRMGIVRLVVFAVLLASAAAVTKLMAMNMQATRNVVWDNAAMNSMINIDMQVYPLSPADAMQSAAAQDATVQRIREAVGDDVAQAIADSFGQQVAYCSVALKNACSTGLSSLLGAPLSLSAAAGVTWSNLTDSLLKREAFLQQLPACSKPGSGCTALAMCWPCHCSMMSKVASANAARSDWVLAVKQECGGFIETLDMHAYVMKGLVSGVLVVLNFVLKAILQLLVEFEKHWTQSDKEHAYAVLAFVSQLLNSVLVLLLVNAQSSIASQAINGALSSNTASRFTSWGSGLILSGAYDDFSPSWYVDVGQSLQLLIIINAAVTGAFALAMWLKRKLHQQLLSSCMPTASQAAWNSAWIGIEFVLDARVSDIMLGLWIILMFGSGIPSLYVWGLLWLLVVELTDRWSLARVCQTPARYGKNLPFLLLGVLPWAAATHCAFGLWMHTHFKASHIGDEQISGLANSSGAAAQALVSTTYFQRVMQVNGLPLLVLLIVHLGLHVLIRFMLYFCGKAFTTVCGCCCKDDTSTHSELLEVTYEEALLARHAQTGCGNAAGGGVAAAGSRPQSTCTKPGVALAGVATYRLPHHPKYSEIFSNPLYKPVWFKAFGRLRYTTLVSRPGGGFIIAPEPILDHDDTDMEQSLSSMSTDLQAMALHMADNSSLEGTGKHKRRSGLLTDELQAMRERSKSVQVAVLAGLGFDSPRGSFTGSPAAPIPLGVRHKILELPGSTGSTTAAAAAGSSGLRPEGGGFGLITAPMQGAAAAAAAGAVAGVGAVGGGSFSLLTAPALGSTAAAAAAGAVLGSGGSFSMLAAPGAASGRSRLSCPGPSGGCDGTAAAAASHQAMVTNSAEDSPVWAAGPDGTTVPWLPVALPGVGVGYVPADYFPAQGLAAAAAAAAAGKAQHEGGHPSEGSISLCGGMGLSPGMVQLQLQEQQQLARELEAATGAAAAGADDDRIGGHPLALRQQAYLQDLPELPQVAACAGGGGGGGTDSTRSSEGVSAVGLPLLPDQGSVGLEGLFLQGSQTMCQGDSYQLHDAPIGVPAAAAAATAEEGLAAQQGAAPGAAAATASRQAAVLAEPGWLSSSVTGQQRQLQGFGLWDGVVAAAAAGTTGSPGSDGATGGLFLCQMPAPLQCNTAAAAAPQAPPPASLHDHQQQQQQHSSHSPQLGPYDLYPAPLPQPQAHGFAPPAVPAVSPGSPQPGFYPNIHLAFAEPPPAYPNVHLTTVELPAGFELPAVVVAGAGSEAAEGSGAAAAAAAAEVDGGKCLSAALLASTRAEHTAAAPVFGVLEQLMGGDEPLTLSSQQQGPQVLSETPETAGAAAADCTQAGHSAAAAPPPVAAPAQPVPAEAAPAEAVSLLASAEPVPAEALPQGEEAVLLVGQLECSEASQAAADSRGSEGDVNAGQQWLQPTGAAADAVAVAVAAPGPAETSVAVEDVTTEAADLAASSSEGPNAKQPGPDSPAAAAPANAAAASGQAELGMQAEAVHGEAQGVVMPDRDVSEAAAVAVPVAVATAEGEGLAELQRGEGGPQQQQQQQEEAAEAVGGPSNKEEAQQPQQVQHSHQQDSDIDTESCCSPRGVSGADAASQQAATAAASAAESDGTAAVEPGAAAAGRPDSRSEGGKKKKHKKGKRGRKGH